MKLMAIDPGLKGGIAIFDTSGSLLETRPLPLHKMRFSLSGKPRPVVDVVELKFIVDAYSINTIVTEYQTAMPGQSSVATATSFMNWGLVLSLRALAQLHIVHPRMWKKHYGLGKDKQAAIRHARNLLGLPMTNASSDGEAEAALIGHYWIHGGSERERAHLELQKSRPRRRKRKASAPKRQAARPRASSPAPPSPAAAPART